MTINKASATIFQEKTIPIDTKLAGWSALTAKYNIQAPVRRPSCIANQHVSDNQREEGDWIIFDKRYWPRNKLAGHLTFAFRRGHALRPCRAASRRFLSRPA